jgi:hypothetical protein
MSGGISPLAETKIGLSGYSCGTTSASFGVSRPWHLYKYRPSTSHRPQKRCCGETEGGADAGELTAGASLATSSRYRVLRLVCLVSDSYFFSSWGDSPPFPTKFILQQYQAWYLWKDETFWLGPSLQPARGAAVRGTYQDGHMPGLGTLPALSVGKTPPWCSFANKALQR